MKALINFKICDNAKECGGIAICPTGAMHYDEEKNTIIVDDNCTCCGLCEKECPIGAIMVAKNENEYNKFIKVIEEDPRKTKDLFVDRYGACPISDFFLIESNTIADKTRNNHLTFIEVFDYDNAMCLLKSIPIKDITDNINGEVFYYKVSKDELIDKEYQITKFPTLLIFKDNKLLGKIEGYYEIKDKEEFEKQIIELITKTN